MPCCHVQVASLEFSPVIVCIDRKYKLDWNGLLINMKNTIFIVEFVELECRGGIPFKHFVEERLAKCIENQTFGFLWPNVNDITMKAYVVNLSTKGEWEGVNFFL